VSRPDIRGRVGGGLVCDLVMLGRLAQGGAQSSATVVPIIPLRKNQGHRDSSIPRKSDEWRSLYRHRSAVEREFGRLKHTYGLAALRVRGIERVRLHADLTMLGRLSLALARARAVPLASA
jgi:DDE family transposase